MKYNSSFLILLIIFLTIFGITVQFLYGFSWTDTSGHSFASDDAFITYRYAKNFFLNHGIYFNPSEKVEGYSNFLYLLMITPLMAISQESIYVYSILLNTLFLFIGMFYFYKILLQETNDRYALLGVLLIGINPAIWANITTGLETTLVLLIFIVMWYLVRHERNNKNIILLFIISTISILARVDGFLFPMILSIYMLINKEYKIGYKLFLYVMVFMLLYAGVRYLYYGDIIANTFYVKVAGDIYQRVNAGANCLYKQTLYNGILFYFIFIMLFFIKDIFYKRLKVPFEFIFILFWLPYMIYIGGDVYFERFLLPILLIGIFYFIKFLATKNQLIINALVALSIFISFSLFYKDGRFAYESKTYDMWVNLGKFLKKAPETYILAIDAAGKVPYYSELYTIDMLGLNNKHIGKMKTEGKRFIVGHTKYNADYIFSRKPDIIAAWLNENEDMAWGISKEKYIDNNFILKYVVNSTRDNLSKNIYDVETCSNKYIKTLIKNGFNYGVLVKKESLKNMPSL